MRRPGELHLHCVLQELGCIVLDELNQAARSKEQAIAFTQQRPQSMPDFTNYSWTTEARLKKGKLSAMRLLV